MRFWKRNRLPKIDRVTRITVGPEKPIAIEATR